MRTLIVNQYLNKEDLFKDNVIFYLKGNGVNGGTSIIDETGKTVTSVNAITSTAQFKYGGSSIYFDNNAYLTFSSPDFNFGTSDFCIEFWYYLISSAEYGSIFNLDGQDHPLCLYNGSQVNGGAPIIVYGSNDYSWFIPGLSFGEVLNNTWYHLAATREGDVFRVFKNGVLMASGTSSSPIGDAGTCHINKNANYINRMYLDSFRVTKGVARYTSNFDPETQTYLS